MRIVFPFLLVLLILPVAWHPASASDSGTFRGKWWNYYDRALERFERGQSDQAKADLAKAISQRDGDQHMARTYGMHFIEYFPHRELGIILAEGGELEAARAELEKSYDMQASAKAAYYLNRVRKMLFERQGAKFPAPHIVIDSPAYGSSFANLMVGVRGKVTAPGFVARLAINGTPVSFDLARKEITFDREIQIEEGDEEIIVTAEDLNGTPSRQVLTFNVDRDGPSVALTEIVALKGTDQGKFRLAGTVEDRTGIREIIVNGSRLPAGGAQQFTLDVKIADQPGSSVEIRAIDLLDNETVAVFDPAQERIAWNRPILLAAAGSFTLFDREPPSITLKDTSDLPQVFVDRYLVEGEAGDNRGVDRIRINGHDMTAAKGKKVFFSKLVKLHEGTNRIIVESWDRSGNQSQASFSVKRILPAARQVSSRMSFSLLPLDGNFKTADLRTLADDILLGAFVEQKRFQMIERTKLKQILQEQKLAAENLTSPEHAVRVGRLVSAEAILATSVREDARSFEIVTRVIGTETGEVLEVQDVYTEDRSMKGIRETMEGLAAKLARSFPVVEGIVIGRDKQEVLVNLGTADKVRRNMGALFYRKGKEIKHPVTGRSLGWDTVWTGEGYFDEVQLDFSRLRLSEKTKRTEVGVKDLLITR